MADWLARAVAAEQAGDLTRAVARFEKYLKANPRRVDVMQHLALMCGRRGDTKRGLRWLQTARRAAPDDPQVLANLGNLLLDTGSAVKAVDYLERSLTLRPRHVGTLFNLGLALEAAGRQCDSVMALEAAARLAPEDTGVRHALEAARRRAGSAADAAAGDIPVRCRQVGRALETGDLVAATALLAAHAGELTPPLLALQVRLDVAMRRPAEAVARLALVPPDAYPGRLNRAELLALVAALGEAGEGARTLPLLEAAVNATPDDAGLLTLLSQASSAAGARERALAASRTAIDVSPAGSPALARAWYQHTRLRRFDAGDDKDRAVLDALQGSLDRLPEGDHAQRADLGFAIGKAREDRGEAAAAFSAYAIANSALKETQRYDRKARKLEVDALLETVTGGRMAHWREASTDSRLPILVVGMPRSGTTLVEQILAAHPHVCAGGERPYLPARVRALEGGGPHWIQRLVAADTAALRALGEGYAADLAAHLVAPASRVTDKLPGNYMHAGLAAALLPRASIVLCTRDLRDLAWSNYTQRFAHGHGYGCDLGDTGFEIAQYARVVTHWRSLLGDRLHVVRNEALIADPQGETRALLAACELPFDARCLSAHEHVGVVGTASDAQVREPVSARSVGRHAPFAEWLGPLFAELETAGL